jgi:hypothetical protein
MLKVYVFCRAEIKAGKVKELHSILKEEKAR